MDTLIQPDTLADFPELVALPTLSELAPTPSEAHGMLCGLLCGGAADALERWLHELLPGAAAGAETASCREALTRLGEGTMARIQGPDLGFAPLLPDADTSLLERALAVHDWSRGFLYGLGLAEVDPQALSGEAFEAMQDFAELTRMDLDELDGVEDEDNEQSLAEIVEFLWVAAMLVYEDRRQQPSGTRPVTKQSASQGADHD